MATPTKTPEQTGGLPTKIVGLNLFLKPIFTYSGDLPDIELKTPTSQTAPMAPTAPEGVPIIIPTSATAPLAPTVEVPTVAPPSSKQPTPPSTSPEPLIPPNIPSIQIRNYKYVNNKVLIMLNVALGENIYFANNYFGFSREQIDSFQSIVRDKIGGVNYVEGLIYSKSTNNETFFVVYRTQKKPQSYLDIIDPRNIVKQLDINLFETSFDDKIQPNKKYYYCFQTVDKLGVYSDASLVYEIEMIDQSGTVYLTENLLVSLPED